ncbi:hypothetical protein PHLCEN_2v6137 [Hermanssonia centrifuga]|uniref:Uncharacterized protein n=1 Tax=Hermanssonia centrifuga TaxID=98765 RepID=A0A2R6P087_9APHY|nr:hypothetical protein PHLCEN_2v6137 [Hermanssonia centrifuga]
MDVVNKIKGVQSRLMTSHNEIEDSSIVLSIKTVMVIYSTMELIKARKPNAFWLECAKSEVIWEAAQTAIDKTLRALNAARMEDGAALTMFDLEAFDTSETSRAFFSARIEIRRCFDKFGWAVVNEKFPDTTIRRGVLAHSHFEQAGKALGMDVDVKSLTPVGAKRTLSLIID